jgi:hypothetical protein
LIDEYRLVVHPVVLGAGERLFTAPLTVEPIRAVAFSGGAVGHVFAAHLYESRRPPRSNAPVADQCAREPGLGAAGTG